MKFPQLWAQGSRRGGPSTVWPLAASTWDRLLPGVSTGSHLTHTTCNFPSRHIPVRPQLPHPQLIAEEEARPVPHPLGQLAELVLHPIACSAEGHWIRAPRESAGLKLSSITRSGVCVLLQRAITSALQPSFFCCRSSTRKARTQAPEGTLVF